MKYLNACFVKAFYSFFIFLQKPNYQIKQADHKFEKPIGKNRG